VNDFLATFPSLYDDVPLEDRGKVLDSVHLVENDEMGHIEEDEEDSTGEFISTASVHKRSFADVSGGHAPLPLLTFLAGGKR
jgi:hypothetical protein